MGQREIKPHPYRGFPAGQHKAKHPFPSGQAEGAHGEKQQKNPSKAGSPWGADTACSMHEPKSQECVF